MVRSVLIVDDSRLARMMVAGLIAERWPQTAIREASNAEEAIAATAESRPDLVILDYNLPGEAGLDVVERLRKLAPAADIVLVTANIQSAIRRRAEEVGCRFVAKPVTAEKMDKLLADIGSGA